MLFGYAQTIPFDYSVKLKPFTISNLSGLHSYVVAQSGGKWLIIGGRKDGLHARQPFNAFPAASNNTDIYVVDVNTQQFWTSPVTVLATGLAEQMQSTNMNFYQDEDSLYMIGGYGYSATAADHITYPNLTSVSVSGLINAVVNGASIIPYFKQITDQNFAVNGGQLGKIDSTFYLVGGHRFDGRYNPMGNPTYTQTYVDGLKKFKINNSGTQLSYTNYTLIIDQAHLHRRDYNAEPQILPNGEEGITMFSGVFQPIVDLPYLNSVTIDSQGYTIDNSFQQYYNHYHCAVLPMYSASNNEMHNIFFGGIAQYYDDLGVLVQDNNVPFVKTIARVTRDASGTLAEYKLPVEMPILLGAGAEFILNRNIPHYDNEVLKLDDIATDSTLVGYIYGGISSTERNIFFSNTGTQTIANSQIFKVYVIKNRTTDIDKLNEQSIGALHMQVFPNPNDGNFTINFHLSKMSEIKIIIQDVNGKFIENATIKNLKLGKNTYSKKLEGLVNGGVYFVTLNTGTEKVTQKIIVEN